MLTVRYMLTVCWTNLAAWNGRRRFGDVTVVDAVLQRNPHDNSNCNHVGWGLRLSCPTLSVQNISKSDRIHHVEHFISMLIGYNFLVLPMKRRAILQKVIKEKIPIKSPPMTRHRRRMRVLAAAAGTAGCLSLLLPPGEVAVEAVVPLDIDETSIAAGIEHSCAIHTDSYNDVGGRVLCWDSDYGGQSSPPSVRSSPCLLLMSSY